MKSFAEELATEILDIVVGKGDIHPQYANCAHAIQRRLDRHMQIFREVEMRKFHVLAVPHFALVIVIGCVAIGLLFNTLTLCNVEKSVHELRMQEIDRAQVGSR